MGSRRYRAVALAAVLAAVGGVAAMAPPPYDWGDDKHGSDPKTQGICRAVKNAPFPAADRLGAPPGSLKMCDPEALYYGIGTKADPVRARQCAYATLTDHDDAPFGPRVMLMTIYANGKGAARNLDLAIHLACGIEDAAPAEHEGRVSHLADMKKPGAKPDEFHYCDDITSGLSTGYCAAHGKAISDARRAAQLSALTARWTPEQKAALAALTKVKAEFVDARSAGEVDLSGTGRVSFSIQEEEAREVAFLRLLSRLERGQGAGADRPNLAAADRDLNDVYRRIQRARPFDYGTVTKRDIQGVQRVWIKYRDAWVAFVKTKYPEVSTDAVQTTLTMERVRMLREFLGE